jgi:hypothetical protein
MNSGGRHMLMSQVEFYEAVRTLPSGVVWSSCRFGLVCLPAGSCCQKHQDFAVIHEEACDRVDCSVRLGRSVLFLVLVREGAEGDCASSRCPCAGIATRTQGDGNCDRFPSCGYGGARNPSINTRGLHFDVIITRMMLPADVIPSRDGLPAFTPACG